MNIPKMIGADLALLFITIIWGSTFTIVKMSLVQVSPLLFIALRFWVATAVILVLMPRSLRLISRSDFGNGLTLAAFLLGGFVFQTVGLRGTTPSNSAFITSLSVLFVPFLGYLIFRHRPSLQTLTGVVLAAVGLGLMTLSAMDFRLRYGDLLTLICAGFFALHILFLGHYLIACGYRQLVIMQVGGSAILCTLFMLILETPFLVWDAAFGLYLFVTGVLATALALYIQNRAQQFTTPNRTALIFSLEPFFAALFAYLILGQSFSVKEYVGGTLIIAGIITSEMRRGSPSADAIDGK